MFGVQRIQNKYYYSAINIDACRREFTEVALYGDDRACPYFTGSNVTVSPLPVVLICVGTNCTPA